MFGMKMRWCIIQDASADDFASEESRHTMMVREVLPHRGAKCLVPIIQN